MNPQWGRCGLRALLCWLAILVPGVLCAQGLVLSDAQMRWISPPGAPPLQVPLPYLWDRQNRGLSGVVEFTFVFAMPQLVEDTYGLYAEKMANAYEVSLNGKQVASYGSLQGPARVDSKLPRVIPLGHDLVPGLNTLQVRLRADAGRQGGLSPLEVSPMAQAQAQYDQVWLGRVAVRFGVAVFSTLVAIVGLALWFTQVRPRTVSGPRRQRLYWYGGVAELLWVFRVADSITEAPPLDLRWWAVLSSLALGGWVCFTVLFCVELAKWDQTLWAQRLRRVLGALMAVGVCCAVGAWVAEVPAVMTLWYGMLALVGLVFCAIFGYHSLFLGKDKACRFMTIAIAVNMVVGVVDWYVLRVRPSTTGSSWIYYSSILFGVAAAAVVLMRFREASLQSELLSANLEDRVRSKEAELAQSYAQLAKLEREQARSAERSRILRDMHDGVGMHLSVALRQVQSGTYDPPAVAGLLQEGLDQLKLSIDALNVAPGDVTALLANLRYRLEPRLRAAGIGLHWLVDELPLYQRLDDKGMRQLQFVVYEAFSNVLQHAQASVITVQAHAVDAGLHLSVADDGRGFDPTQVPRRGLGAMRDRVQALGGTLHLRSEPGHTLVEVLLP